MAEFSTDQGPDHPPEAAGIDGFAALSELFALDMRWSWNHEADRIWQRLDPTLWDLTHNPWVVLQTVSREKIRDAMRRGCCIR